MKASLRWLQSYITIDKNPKELAETLTLLGHEVEDLEFFDQEFPGVVVGEVLTCIKHPNADRLMLCTVEAGEEQPLQIVCGAPNVAAGQKVPVAKVGTILPHVTLADGSPLKLERRKVRGEYSEGMICAEDELGLGEDHSGIMVLKTDLVNGTEFKKFIDLESDVVFDIALTPNRPDAASHLGLARDLAAKYSLPFPSAASKSKSMTAADEIKGFTVSSKDVSGCPRYVGIRIENVTVKPSPRWLQTRLERIGVRSVNNIVDATNYVLHSLGQPLHAFDADKLRGNKIVVKSFDENMEFTTLDSVQRKIPAGSLFICDGEGPVALAGIMGGENSEISDATVNVLLESAYFDPVRIRKTSKHLALSTDASYRFERGVDPGSVLNAGLICAEMIAELSGGTVIQSYADFNKYEQRKRVIDLRPARVNDLLGTDLSTEEIKHSLTLLGIQTRLQNHNISCEIPSFRIDLEREVDLIEEVARLLDYNTIPAPSSQSFIHPEPLPAVEKGREKIREHCVRLGFNEIYTNSLLPELEELIKEPTIVRTLNPISKEQSLLRPDLSFGMLKAIEFNLNRGQHSLRLFEIGRTFRKTTEKTLVEGISEREHLILATSGLAQYQDADHSERQYSVNDVKKAILALFRDLGLEKQLQLRYEDPNCLLILIDGSVAGSLQVLHPRSLRNFDITYPVFVAEFEIDRLFDLMDELPDARFQAPSKFPGIEFDLAFVLPKKVIAQQLSEIIFKQGTSLLIDTYLFDYYEGKNIPDHSKSLAYRLYFEDTSKTLTIEDIQPIIDSIVKCAKKDLGAELRS